MKKKFAPCQESNGVWKRIQFFSGPVFLLILLTLSFNAVLSTLSLEKLYIESLVSRYQVVGDSLRKKVELSIQFGKKIEKFYGIHAIMERRLQDMADNQSRGVDKDHSDLTIDIVHPDGIILYSTNPSRENIPLDNALKPLVDERIKNKKKIRSHEKEGERFYLMDPILDWRGDPVAVQLISFHESLIVDQLKRVVKRSVYAGVAIIFLGTLLTVVAMFGVFSRSTGKGQGQWDASQDVRQLFPKRTVWAILFCIICFCQVVFSWFSISGYRLNYLQISKEKIKTLNLLMKEDIDHLVDKGIPLDKLYKAEVMLGRMTERLPEISDISIFDHAGKILYRADHSSVIHFNEQNEEMGTHHVMDRESPYNLTIAIGHRDNPVGWISSTISRQVLNDKLRSILLDFGTIIIISIFFCVELMILTLQRVERKIGSVEGGQADGMAAFGVIRPVSFMFFFGIDIAISFLPLHMKTLYQPIPGISKEMVLGLPITVQMFFTALSILIAGNWCDKRGWNEPFIIGLVLSAGGFVSSWLAGNPYVFLISLGFVGFGYGLSYLAVQGFVIYRAPAHLKAKGLSELYAGCIAGSICGGASGAMLADRIGYSPVFLLGAIILVFVSLWTVFTLKDTFHKPKPAEALQKTTAHVNAFRFITNKNILILILCSSLPAAIALVGFMNYFSPIYLNTQGVSQSNIGRVFMIFGICLIYISPFITNHLNVLDAPRRYIAISGMLGSVAFILFFFMGGLVAISFGMLFLGLSACFNACRNAYAINLDISKKTGEGRALAIIFFVARLGQAAGPVIFGWLVSVDNASRGIVRLGLLYLMLALVFVLFSRDAQKTAAVRNA